MRIGASAETEGARRLWICLQAEIQACERAAQMQLSQALGQGRPFDELPPWARSMLGRVWLGITGK